MQTQTSKIGLVNHNSWLWRFRLSASLTALAGAAIMAPAAIAQTDSATQNSRPTIRIAQNVPPGFEAIDESIDTVFDIYLSGRRIGIASVRVSGGQVYFKDAEALLAILPDRVDRAKVAALIALPLPSNEALRCLPGRTADCGLLPPNEAGIIVANERFSLELFLPPEYYSELSTEAAYLGDPISGPSLIQTALLSVSAGSESGSGVTFGGTFNTLASIGRTSFVGQTFVRDDGANIQRAYVQHFWQKRYAAGGLLQQATATTFNSYRLLGGEYGSFFGARRDITEGLRTPLEIVLPRAAQVEVYRDNVLIQTTRLEAGLQQVNTLNFPNGSYQVRIVAKDGGDILLDEIRSFTRAGNLPPVGEWQYKLRAGVRVSDLFSTSNSLSAQQPFFPEITNDPLFSASLGRRINRSTGVTAEVLSVGSKVYGETAVTTYQGRLKGVAAAAVGTDGAYSFLLNASTNIGRFDLNLAGRHTKIKDDFIGPRDDRFRPFSRSEDSVIAGVGFAGLGGNFSLNGSYTKTPFAGDRYTVAARYTRSFEVGSFGLGRLTAFALQSDFEKRVGITMTFQKRIDRQTLVTYGGGAEYRSSESITGNPDGLFPVADARISRQDRFGEFDLNTQAGLSTDAVRNRAFVAANVGSNYGSVDAQVDYEDRRGGSPGSFGVSANLFSGFVVGGGQVKFGMREGIGDAAIIVKVADPAERAATVDGDVGHYRIVVGNQLTDTVTPGSSSTKIASSFQEYRIGLRPEGSPPYTVDLSVRNIPLYPGNVALVEYDAYRIVTVFGRLLDEGGKPVGGARVAGPTDITQTDENGYFILSAKLDDFVDFYGKSGQSCARRLISSLIKADTSGNAAEYLRAEDITCPTAP